MVSNSSLPDLFLITHEEYTSLKRQDKTLGAREKQKQQLHSKFEATESKVEHVEEEYFKSFITAEELPEDTLVAQLNLNSRYQSEDLGSLNNTETKQSCKNPADQVLSKLLESDVT